MTAKQWLGRRLAAISEERAREAAVLALEFKDGYIAQDQHDREMDELREWADRQREATLEDLERTVSDGAV